MNGLGGWTFAAASVRGSAHVRSRLPNQDAHAVEHLPSGAVVAAVADGHGGARYVRSDRGSAFAVSTAIDTTKQWWDNGGSAQLTERSGRDLLRQIIDGWHRAVHDDAARRPFTDDEWARAGTDPAQDVAVSYGATLLLAVGTPDRMLLAQLGDGDIIVVSRDGVVRQPVPGDERLRGGQTTSLCLPTAIDDCRFATLDADDHADLLILSSDGYGNSFAAPDWRERVAIDLLDHVRSRGVDAVSAELPQWVGESAEAGGDDVTVVLLSRDERARRSTSLHDRTVPVPVDGPASSSAAASTTAPPARAQPAPTRRGSRAKVLAVAAVAAIVGVGIGATVTAIVRSDGAEGSDVPALVTTTGSAPDTSVPQAAPIDDALEVRGPLGDRIAFVADSRTPNARVVGRALPSTPPLVRDLEIDGHRWRVTDRGALEVKSGASNWQRVPLGGPDGAALVFADGLLFVIDAEQAALIVVDPRARAVLDTHPIANANEPPAGGSPAAPTTR